MSSKAKLEIVAHQLRELDPTGFDAFSEDRVRRDLARVAASPGLFSVYVERARVRFQKASERAVLERWIEFYSAGERLIAAKTVMERKRSEYLQLAREHEIKETEKAASLAKLRADIEEQGFRFDKTVYQRGHIEHFVEGGQRQTLSENRQKLEEAEERRQLDARWQDYLQNLTAEDLEETVCKVSSSSGQRHATRCSDVLLHVCTHAHYTTAQVINMLRHSGAF